jgi:superfamily II DNA or RNA helicase
MIDLRPYQHGAIGNLRASIGAGNNRVLLQAATGAGKTIIACEMIRRATDKSKRVIFIAHRKEIIHQTSGKLDAFGIDHGVIMASHGRVNNHAVQVASIQTLTRRDKPKADLVIIDECHLSVSASFKQIVEHYHGATIIGLTATPIRLDGRGLGEIYGDIVQVVPMAQLISEGHLVKPRVFAPFTPDMRGIKKSKGDYDATQTAKLMDKKEITADIVKHWATSAADRKTIVFASSVEHSKNIVSEFMAIGISAKHLDANTPANERDQTLSEWRDGKFTVLSNMGLFIEGLDVPAASCCILARPTKSLTIYLQAVGRVMRPHESKTDCIILDCAGLTYEHGFVDDHREWTLNGKIKRPKDDVPAVHICEECFAAYSKAQHPNECPECGFETPTEQRETKHADVDMVELTKDVMAQIRAKRIKRLEVGKCKTLDDFIELGKLRGYKAGWAYIKWNERKAWLKSHGYDVPMEPTE